ncbi:MAG: TonB-dependent receptor [Deltaproteobacteria bacterium]|nr:MAG: TonB-dependent receptor [Deltaproteobacteria bacterium]
MAAPPRTATPSPSAAEPASDDDGAPTYRTVVRQRAGRDRLERIARQDARAVGFTAAVDVDHATRDRPADAWTEALRGLAGVYVRSFGGLGRFTAISVRGSTAAQVQVLYEGVPVEDAVGGSVDLSMLSADVVDLAVVHRGYVPVRYGGAAIGGALRLSSDMNGTFADRIRLGLGSFGAYELRGSVRRRIGGKGPTLTAAAAVAGAEGDFPYLDPGAPHDRFDDRTRTRRNNDYGRISARLAVAGRRRRARWFLTPIGQIRDRGIPGPAGARWDGARESERLGWVVAGADAPLPRPGSTVGARLSARGSLRTFRDPEGSVGLGRNDQVQASTDTFGRATTRLAAWRGAFVELSGDGRVETTRIEDRLAAPGRAPRNVRLRFGTGIELEQSFVDGRWVLAIGDRIEALESRFEGDPTAPVATDAATTMRFGHTPRAGLRVRPHPSVRLRATAGRYFRPPTFVELFGDRGYAVGNDDLVPETGWNVDGGLSFDVDAGEGTRLVGSAAGFYTRARDLITWVQAGFVTRAENVPGAHVAGAEAQLDGRLLGGTLETHAAYTFLHTVNLDQDPARHGNPLPGRPAHQGTFALDVAPKTVVDGVLLVPRVGYEAEIVAATNLDPSGRYVLPPRIFHAITFGVAAGCCLVMSLSVRNVADRRTAYVRPPVDNLDGPIRVPIADVLGYPLPGRSLWFSAAVTLPRGGRGG